MSNPYQTPAPARSVAGELTDAKLPMQPQRGLVGHVRVISILMFVQAGLELLMGVFYAVFGFIYPLMLQAMIEEQAGRPNSPGPPPQAVFWVAGGMMAMFGLTMFAIAGMRIYAGYRNYQFRSRTLGIVSLALGFATVITCYCAPSAIALAVYGLIVYLNPQATLAFQFGEQGHKGDHILASFPSS